MRKLLSIFFILVSLVCCGLFYGCGDRYGDLTFSVEVCYDGAIRVDDLNNGDKRVTLRNGGAFDDHLDGTYTFYILRDTNTKTTATIQANFSGEPDDFNYEITHSLSTEILSVSRDVKYTDSGVKTEITANSKGRTELTVLNVESGKKDMVVIDVVEVATSMSFVNKDLAIVKEEGSTLTLNSDIVKLSPESSSLTNITYSIGYKDEYKNFVAWSDAELLSNGLRFNKRDSVIDVFEKSNLKVDTFCIRAVYDNPIGEDIEAVTDVRVVNEISKNVEVYEGKTIDDIKDETKLISTSTINDLIVNIEGLSDKNIILKVTSNGEEVRFSYIHESIIPVYFTSYRFAVKYYDNKLEEVLDYKQATYALCFIKVCASTKTTSNFKYPNGTYAVKFTCDYKNYMVDNYPVTRDFIVKNDNLITSFSINKNVVENFSILKDKTKKPYKTETYINSSSDVNGVAINIDVGNTDSILQANRKFNLALYKYNGTSYEEVTEDVTSFFTIKYGIGKSTDLSRVTDENFATVFDCNTTFYFTPGREANLNDIFYLIVTAQKPTPKEIENNGEKQVIDKRANATIEIKVVKGIDNFTHFNYSYKRYKVDKSTGQYELVADEPIYAVDPATGKFIIDPETGEYVLGKPITYSKVVEEIDSSMTFTDTLMSAGSINLDLASGFDAEIELIYTPEGASLNNIEIISTDNKVLEVERDKEAKNKFKIKPRGIGKEYVKITASHLDKSRGEYYIAVNVYYPISNFNVRLASNSPSAGIGACVVDEKEGDIKSAVVQVRKEIDLILTTTPTTSNEYTLEFFVSQGEVDRGYYRIDYNGKTSSVSNTIGDADFMLTCAKGACSFVFTTDSSAENQKEYKVVIKLTNIEEGCVITKEFTLRSYIPIKTIKTEATSRVLYNPNTISYLQKTNDINDPSVFGLKIELLADSKDSVVTYGFKGYGKILLSVNTIQETEFNCDINGRLTYSRNGVHILTVLNDGYPSGDYYWFKLNENYDFSKVVGAIYYSIQIDELIDVPSDQPRFPIIQTYTFRAINAEAVTTLATYTDEQLYYKQGFYSEEDKNSATNKLIDVQVLKDTAYNKNFRIKVFDIVPTANLKEEERNFYYDLSGNDEQTINCVENIEVLNGKNSTQFNLRITPENAGQSVIVIMPEDKIITKEHYDIFFNKEYRRININKETFENNIFYIYKDGDYVIAEEYVEGTEYFTLSTNLDDVLSLWLFEGEKGDESGCLVFYMSVADGIKVPYQIASYEDLKEISANATSVTKRYVLRKDIVVPTTENWEAIGNYYSVGTISEEEFNLGEFYTYNEEINEYVKAESYEKYVPDESENPDEEPTEPILTEYFAYGFKGEINGMFYYFNVKTKVGVENYYKVLGISCVGEERRELSGFISSIGRGGSVLNMSVSYSMFRPTLVDDYIFGGITATNYGYIENSITSFDNFTISTEYKINIIIGGIAGKNIRGVDEEKTQDDNETKDDEIPKGVINNNKLTNIGNKGVIRAVALNKDVNLVLGGLVGINEGELYGSYISGEEVEYTFNDAGFNSSLSIIAELVVGDETATVINSSIGGAVGTNKGLIKDVSIKGTVNAPKFDNVGGLVGKAEYLAKYNEEDNYSIDSSYSIANVTGNNNVGGAIGYVKGTSEGTIKIKYVSAENYATPSNYARVFVDGRSTKEVTNIGGLIGFAEFVTLDNCYVVSYFECMPLTEKEGAEIKYDIVGKNAGGFIGNASSVKINACASFVNVNAENKADLFILTCGANIVANNVFVIGYAKGKGAISHNCINTLTIGGFYYYIASDKSGTTRNVTIRDKVSSGNISAGDIITHFNNINDPEILKNWEINSKSNSGLPYLTITFATGRTEPLFATTPLEVSANVRNGKFVDGNFVRDENEYLKFIRNDDSSLIIFYNYDFLSRYKVNDINKLNLESFLEYVFLEVYPKTSKSARLDISTSNSSVIAIESNGMLRIMGEGRVTLTISSKLNSNYKAQVYIVVKYGVSNVNVYKDISSTISLNGQDIDILKSTDHALYVDVEYIRDLEHQKGAVLKSSGEVGIRFRVDEKNSKLNEILASGIEASTIGDIFKFNGSDWVTDGTYSYVDISGGITPVITPFIAMEDVKGLEIEYIPYIKTTFNDYGIKDEDGNIINKALESTILLDKEGFFGSFTLSISKGATAIIFENNLDLIPSEVNPESNCEIEISQLETITFTLTVFTDNKDIDNRILDNFETEARGLQYHIGEPVPNYEDATSLNPKKLVSISITYTITYEDKINAVEEDIDYFFNFRAVSNPNIQANLHLKIISQDKINQAYGTIYSKTSDFPQSPNKNNVIYNGQVGVISIDVYPYFSNYTRMNIRYRTPSGFPMLITQLSYDISGEKGKFLDNYPESGSIQNMTDVMHVEKSSGQDNHIQNETGKYSYSKIYFFSLLVGSEVPDRTPFTFYVDFINRKGEIIETCAYDFVSQVLPSVEISLDQKLIDNEKSCYYLPINTTQEVDVKIVNFEGEVDWKITPLTADYFLTQNEIDVLTPQKTSDGTYKFNVYKYEGNNSSNNVFTTDAIGKKLRLTASIKDNENYSEFSVDFVITMFTVTNVTAQNVKDGVMTIPMSTTTPLFVSLETSYDESIVSSPNDNWYKRWYDEFGKNKKESDLLYSYLRACGYEIEEYFTMYFNQLSNAVAKADYNYNETSVSTKISGVWFYNSGDENSGYLQVNKDYNNSTFGVEQYNEYISIYGYQIDRNSKMQLRTNISYVLNRTGDSVYEKVNGIPNVYGYSIAVMDDSFTKTKSFTDDFTINFVYKSDLIDAIPVSTAEEFLTMQEGFDYRLVNDIELTNYTPISTPIASFDGNNYNIYITSFSYDENNEEESILSLFNTVSEKTMLYNVTVYYTTRIIAYGEERLTPSPAGLTISQKLAKEISFGGVAITNNGILTNCKATGKVSFEMDDETNIPTSLIGGLVATNGTTGYITNSSVVGFDLNCYGTTGGFVGVNNGKIVSSFFNASSVNNISSSIIAGFCYENNGEIYECYSQGYRDLNDTDIRNTGAGIEAKGDASGFVYRNTGSISDCYSNISLKSSSGLSGFVYTETRTSIISRCYSICYKASTDNKRIASPFAGTDSEDYKIYINGQLNYCYYLTGGTWSSVGWPEGVDSNKKATELTSDQFQTHASFSSFDLSLVYTPNQHYVDGDETYSYVDGYTWVIIDGKPVLVSTLVKTISQRNYIGKTKSYKETIEYYDANSVVNLTSRDAGSGLDEAVKKRVNYYSAPDEGEVTEKDLIFYTIQDNDKDTLTYYFLAGKNGGSSKNDNSDEKDHVVYDGAITIMFKIEHDEEGKISTENLKNAKLLGAEYNKDGKIVVLDARIEEGSYYVEDSNYRANDTIEIYYDTNGIISNIKYKVLENASYYYGSGYLADIPGSRTNPELIYDYTSFVFHLNANTAGRFFRIIKDIDFVGKNGYYLPETVYSNFQGVLQGNYMELNQISISYVNYVLKEEEDKKNNINSGYISDDQVAFGLFGTISTAPDIQNFNTVISNLTLNVVEVLSNTHERVGALAGLIHTDRTIGSNKMLILNNITIGGMNNRSAYVQGKNAAGGLAGIILGDVIIKDITVSANVNATKDVSSGNVGEVLYTTSKDISRISYAGGIAGILDCNSIVDASTKRNYNASNVHFYGNVHVIGGVIGMAFGLVGRESVVNYANVDISNENNNYIESCVYAGGIVGENRGQLISSSISYRDKENNANVAVAFSSLIERPLFRSSAGSDSVIASGGIVGINNGGIVSNCLSSVDVRDSNSKVCGGAIGRMITGKLENVIATGSVMSKSITGGLIGTANDFKILTDAGYREEIIFQKSVEEKTGTIIKNCVAANNWLSADYWQYDYLLINNNAIAGFIGLIANTSSGMNFIEYENYSYYTNTLYSSTSATIPQRYLKVAYHSSALDLVSDISKSSRDVLVDSSDNQAVFPYSTREMYYEDAYTDIFYKLVERQNNKTEDGYVPASTIIYEFREYNGENKEDFFTAIDFNDPYWKSGIGQYEWTSSRIPDTLEEYRQHFGVVYEETADGDFKVISCSEEKFKTDYLGKKTIYYIRYNELKKFVKTKRYLTSGINDINLSIKTSAGTTTGNKFNSYTFTTKTDIEKVNNISINGIELKIGNKTSSVDGEAEYQAVYDNLNCLLPNGTIVTKVVIRSVIEKFKVDGTEALQDFWTAASVDVTYSYENVDYSHKESSSEFIYVPNPKNSGNVFTYSLYASSKKVIYNSFLNNGYWNAPKNFLVDENQELEDSKYLVNLEYADVYLWSDFASTEISEENYNANDTFNISTPEEFAMIAKMVNGKEDKDGNIIANSGKTFSGKTINLTDNIDLSGKFWVPMGNTKNPFMGTFNGNNKVIKYVTVNESSNTKAEGLGGLFGYISGASIKNLQTMGGDISGTVVGGIIAISNGKVEVTNILNRNNVTGETSTGGVIGKILTTESTQSIDVTNIKNYGNLEHNNPQLNSSQTINIGGVIGNIDSVSTGNFENLVNHGTITTLNNQTTYSGSGVKITLNVGGVFGELKLVGGNYTKLNNHGNITINSNADNLNAGGVVGITDDALQITVAKNYANINVSYNNIYNVGVSTAYYASAMVGGIAGRAEYNIVNSGNEGQIKFNLSTTSDSFVAIGGVAGSAAANVSKSYNANNIEVYTITRKTSAVVGGVVGGLDITTGNRAINDCYNSGTIECTSSSKLFVGGINGSSYIEDTQDGRKFAFNVLPSSFFPGYKDYKASISTCLNTGKVKIIAIDKFTNALGAIAGFGNIGMTFNQNYYLRDTASSGNYVYKAYCLHDDDDKDNEDRGYYPVDSETVDGKNDNVNYAKLISSLKNTTTYSADWGFANGLTNTWMQYYDTWYPSLRENTASSMWRDKAEEVSQEQGSLVIKSAEELAYLSNAVNSGKLDTSNLTIKLVDFIDLSNRYWIPIGTEEFPFRGNFNGNGYVIKNLTIDGNIYKEDEEDAYLKEFGGLFGVCEDAVITDIGLESIIVQNVNYASSLAYSVKNCRISRIYTSGVKEDKKTPDENRELVDSKISGLKGAGGLIYNAEKCSPEYADDASYGIYYSYNDLPVYKIGSGNGTTGGLVGVLNNSKIYNSYNNYYAIVSTTNGVSGEGKNHGSMIVGQAMGDNSQLFNVFNLAPLFYCAGEETELKSWNCSPLTYKVSSRDENIHPVDATDIEPKFENLENLDENNPLSNIWTQENEYTLNSTVNGHSYPSIRGLGGSWKNTESESLIGIDYMNSSKEIPRYVEQYINDVHMPNTMVNPYYDVDNPPTITGYDKTYYLIATEEELAWVSNNVNSGSLTTANAEFILLKDLNLSGRYWTPIGSSSTYAFQGIFNLNGHRISGITIDSSNLLYGGLFGYTNGAKIVNGYITDSFIKLISNNTQTNVYAGAVVGRGYNTSLENLYISTSISVNAKSGTFVGGAIGSLTGTKNYQIKNVYVTKTYYKINGDEGETDIPRYIDILPYINEVVEVQISKDENGEDVKTVLGKFTEDMVGIGAFTDGGNVYIGGIVGYASGYGQGTSGRNTIDNVYSDVNLAGVTKSTSSRSYAGGIIGYALSEVKMENLYSSCKVKTFTNQYDFVGGIAGYINDSNIINAYFDGYVEPCQQFNNHIISRVGGIVAFVESTGILTHCVNNGEINSNGKYEGNTHIGGIIGYSRDRTFANDERLIYNEDFIKDKPIGYYELDPYIQEERKNNYQSYIDSGMTPKEANEKINEDAKKKADADVAMLEKFSTSFASIVSSNGFNMNYWYNTSNSLLPIDSAINVGFNVSRTYITGNDDSLKLHTADGASLSDGIDLYKSGYLVKDMSTAQIKYQNGSFKVGDKLRVSGRTKGTNKHDCGEYFYKEYEISTTDIKTSTNGALVIFLNEIVNIDPNDPNAINFDNSVVVFVQLIPYIAPSTPVTP